MEFSIQREELLKPLQKIIGAVEKKQTQAILGNILLQMVGEKLTITASDLEIELKACLPLKEASSPGETTVSARKFVDICRNLPEGDLIFFRQDTNQLILRAAKSRFTLVTLPAENFPSIETLPGELEFSVKAQDLRYLLDSCYFSMAQNDVRYYMNGLLLQIDDGSLRSVATDGHRLAVATLKSEYIKAKPYQFILPRKGGIELMRLLSDEVETDSVATLTVNAKHLRVYIGSFTYTSKLVEGKFPDYTRVIPNHSEKIFSIERESLKNALIRTSILSSDKYKAVRLQLRSGLLQLVANNQEQEEAIEEIAIDYSLGDLDIGFNVSYLIDILNHAPPGKIQLAFTDSNGGLRVTFPEDEHRFYVVMPMRL